MTLPGDAGAAACCSSPDSDECLLRFPHREFVRCVAWGLLAGTAAGCSAPSAPAPGLTARDSAGVRIVERTGASEETWHLIEPPEIELGGDEQDDLFRVRGAALLTDGRVAVANGGSGEIRYYGPHGRLLASSGGRGGGPGEFSMLLGFALTGGDSLVAFDARGGPLSVFGPDGRMTRSIRPETVPGYTSPFLPVGELHPGLLAVRARLEGAQGVPPGAGQRTESTPEGVLLFGPGGEPRATLGPFDGVERTIHVSSSGGGSFSIRSVAVPFQKELHAAAGAGMVAVGHTARSEIEVYDARGELRAIIRDSAAPRAVTPADLDAWVAHRFGVQPRSAVFDARRREIERTSVPQTVPAFEALGVDAAGRIWIREFQVPGTGDETRWLIVDPTQPFLAEILMPSAFRPHHIGDDFVVGVWTDDLGVERVRVYRLAQGAPTDRR